SRNRRRPRQWRCPQRYEASGQCRGPPAPEFEPYSRQASLMGNSLYCLSAFRAGVAAARVLPRGVSRWIGESIAIASYGRRPEAQRALRSNLQGVTGEKGAALDALCAENVRNFGRMIADYF